MTIGELIKITRKAKNLTIIDVARYVGVDKTTVSRWESGDIHKMGRDKIDSLCRYLDLDPVLFVMPPEVLTQDERSVLYAFRSASDEKKDAVRDVLHVPQPQKDTEQSAI